MQIEELKIVLTFLHTWLSQFDKMISESRVTSDSPSYEELIQDSRKSSGQW